MNPDDMVEQEEAAEEAVQEQLEEIAENYNQGQGEIVPQISEEIAEEEAQRILGELAVEETAEDQARQYLENQGQLRTEQIYTDAYNLGMRARARDEALGARAPQVIGRAQQQETLEAFQNMTAERAMVEPARSQVERYRGDFNELRDTMDNSYNADDTVFDTTDGLLVVICRHCDEIYTLSNIHADDFPHICYYEGNGWEEWLGFTCPSCHQLTPVYDLDGANEEDWAVFYYDEGWSYNCSSCGHFFNEVQLDFNTNAGRHPTPTNHGLYTVTHHCTNCGHNNDMYRSNGRTDRDARNPGICIIEDRLTGDNGFNVDLSHDVLKSASIRQCIGSTIGIKDQDNAIFSYHNTLVSLMQVGMDIDPPKGLIPGRYKAELVKLRNIMEQYPLRGYLQVNIRSKEEINGRI